MKAYSYEVFIYYHCASRIHLYCPGRTIRILCDHLQ